MSALGPETENERQAQLQLSRANLLRVRGQLQEAIDACAEALRLAPMSGDACAMLAEIYEEQGKLDEALQWYGMAVDNSPANPSYREHLKRLAEQRQASLEKQRALAVAPPKERTLELEAQTGKGNNAARIVWAVCGVLFLVLLIGVIFYVTVLRNGKPQQTGKALDSKEDVGVKLAGPGANLTPPTAPPLATPPAATPAPTNPTITTPNNAAGITLRLGTDVAYLNPATGLALREGIPQRAESREVLVRQALRLAAEVSHADARVKTIQITLKTPGATIPELIAEIGAYDAIKVSESAPLSELMLVFKSLRWPEDGGGAPPANG